MCGRHHVEIRECIEAIQAAISADSVDHSQEQEHGAHQASRQREAHGETLREQKRKDAEKTSNIRHHKTLVCATIDAWQGSREESGAAASSSCS